MSRSVKILVAYNFFIVFGFGLLTPIFAVFITKQIIGATVAVAGIAEAIYLGTKGIGQIFVADYLDIEQEDKRNWRWALIGSLIFGLSTPLYIFCHRPIHLYLVELVMGIAAALEYPAFYSLFLRHLDRRRKAFQLSLHNTIIELGTAVAAAIGGVLASYFGFFNLFFVVMGCSLFGTILLITMYPSLSKEEKKEHEESTKDSLPVVSSSATIAPKVLGTRHYGDPVLRDRARSIKEINDEVRQLAADMIVTMVQGDGVGLAANQVGQLKRLIVVDIGQGPMVLINPKILDKSKKREALEEGCLSLPGLSLRVRRSCKINLEYFQLSDGKRIKLLAEGILARVVLHEIDHLDGVLLIDKLSFWQRGKFKKQILAIRQQTQQEIKDREKNRKTKEKILVDDKSSLPSIPPNLPPPPSKIS
jgi:peptide deformylase